MSSKRKFVVSHLDQQSGPFDETELRAKWERGDLLPIDYVFDDAKQDWVLVAERFEWARMKKEATKEPTGATPPPLTEDSIRRRGNVVRRSATQIEKAPTPATMTSISLETEPGIEKGPAVKLKNGFGEIELPLSNPGEVELLIKNSSTTLPTQGSLKISVKAAHPVELRWSVIDMETVGKEVEVLVHAVDELGKVCTGFSQDYQVHIESETETNTPLKIQNGTGRLHLKNTKAEVWTLTLSQHGQREQLLLPAPHLLTWQPGPAARLVLDGPTEYIAGHPIKVRVKAVDQFGNLAETYQGTVVLEIKAS